MPSISDFVVPSYRYVTSINDDDECVSCHDLLKNENGKPVAHSGLGIKHPVHLECVKDWVNLGHKNCMSCSTPTDVSSLFNETVLKSYLPAWKLNKKLTRELKNIARDAFIGMAAGSVVFYVDATLPERVVKLNAVVTGAAISAGYSLQLLVDLNILPHKEITYGAKGITYAGRFPVTFATIASFMKNVVGMNPSMPSMQTIVTGLSISEGLSFGFHAAASFTRGTMGLYATLTGVALSALGLVLVGTGIQSGVNDINNHYFEQKLDNLANLQEAYLEIDALIYTTVLTTLSVVTFGAVVGGCLGRRFSRH